VHWQKSCRKVDKTVCALNINKILNSSISHAVLEFIAIVSKLTFVSLVLIYGRQYLGQAGIAVAIDLVIVGLFIVYLLGDRQRKPL